MKRFIFLIASLVVAGLIPADAAMNTKGPQLRPSASGSAQAASARKPSAAAADTVKVTLTTYWARGRGSDRWTRQFQSATGLRLQQGISVAADPEVFPYGSIIDIPGVGRRVVKDTGTDVVQRVASRKRGVNYPVIDIFFESRKDALQFARNNPPFAEVRIVQVGG